MKLTEVNKLSKVVKNARSEYYALMSSRWGPRWLTGPRMSMVLNPAAAKRLNENINRVIRRVENAERNLNSALNRNANSLQARERETRRSIAKLYQNHTNAVKALDNLNARWRRAVNNAEKERIEQERIPHKATLQRYNNQREIINAEVNRLRKDQRALMSAIEMRTKILTRAPSAQQAAQTIGRSLSRTIVARTLYGPYGTRTLNATRRFPGHREPTLEEYAEARREIDRLKRRMK
jgi:hypothetical protein